MTARLRWRRGRGGAGSGDRILEWIGLDAAGTLVGRVIRLPGPLKTARRSYPAVALDKEGRIVELRPTPPDGVGWLACIGDRVVGRAALPLQAVRTVEAALD